MKRNNTSFPLHLKEFISQIPLEKELEIEFNNSISGVSFSKGTKKDKKVDGLKDHQRIIVEYYLHFIDQLDEFDARGILAYMSMGSGKTILSIAIAENLKPRRKVIFIAAKTLHGNAVKDIKKYKRIMAALNNEPEPTEEELDNHIKEWYGFVSSNSSNMFEKVSWLSVQADQDYMKKPKKMRGTSLQSEGDSVDKMFGTLSDKLIIVDEAQDLFNSIVNGSKNASDFYNLIMNTKDVRLLFLSGTPVVNDPFELVPCYNMLSGYLDTDTGKGNEELLGLDYKMFHEYFINRPLNTIVNKEKFQNRIIGLTAYYNVKSDPEMLKKFPEQKQTIIEKVPMSGTQYSRYLIAREKEIEEVQRASKFKKREAPLQKPKGSSSSYRIDSRQVSNYLIPDYAIRDVELEDGRTKKVKLVDEIKKEDLLNMDVYSPKFKQMINNIEKHLEKGQLGLVYSQFVESGIYLFGRTLEALGYQQYSIGKVVRKSDVAEKLIKKSEEIKEQREEELRQLDKNRLETQLELKKETPEIETVSLNDTNSISNSFSDDIEININEDLQQKENMKTVKSAPLAAPGEAITTSYEKSESFEEQQLDRRAQTDKKRFRDLLDEDIVDHIIQTESISGEGDSFSIYNFVDGSKDTKKKEDKKKKEDETKKNIKIKKRKIVSNNKKVKKKDLVRKISSSLTKFAKGTMRNFTIISGDVPIEDRNELIKIFTSKENRNGKIIGVLLISSTGAQGLDLKNIRHIHIMEPFWHWSRIAQVLARGVRMDSHIELPLGERNVQPYIYLSDSPYSNVPSLGGNAAKSENQVKEVENQVKEVETEKKPKVQIQLTTDLDLYVKAVKNQMLIDTFMAAIREAAIGYAKAKVCSPTDKELFVPKLTTDMRVPSPCKKLEEENISVKKIEVNDHTYYYKKEADGTPIIYDYDQDLGGFVEISARISSEYDRILERIK